MRTDGVGVTAPAFDDDLRLYQAANRQPLFLRPGMIRNEMRLYFGQSEAYPA
jgi:hypothetical protein